MRRCTYPLTALGAVTRVYTNLAVLDVTGDGFVVREMVPGLTFEALQDVTDAPLKSWERPRRSCAGSGQQIQWAISGIDHSLCLGRDLGKKRPDSTRAQSDHPGNVGSAKSRGGIPTACSGGLP